MTSVIDANGRASYSDRMTTYAARWRALMTANTIDRGPGALVLLMTVALLPACSSKPAADLTSLAPPFLETPVAPRPAATSATGAKGKQLYEANCVQCHGAEGKGDGYGAPFLVPPPRDFTAGQFKCSGCRPRRQRAPQSGRS